MGYSGPSHSRPEVLKGHQGPVTALVSFENTFVSCSLDKTIRIWEQTGSLLCIIVAEAEVYSLAGLDESTFASGCAVGSSGYENFAIKLWDIEGVHKYKGSLRGHGGPILALTPLSKGALKWGLQIDNKNCSSLLCLVSLEYIFNFNGFYSWQSLQV